MADCNLPNTDPLLEEKGGCTPSTDGTTNAGCETTVDGIVRSKESVCTPWDMTDGPEAAIIGDYIEESLLIGAAKVNVHKLLGVHEQGKLQDLSGNGAAISSGHLSGFPPEDAFDKYITEWRSAQIGTGVIGRAYIGYDFGQLKLSNDRNQYGLDTFVKFDISTIKIKQGCDAKNRATKARVERSNDGEKWYGVAIVTLPDCGDLVTVNFKRSVPSRWWRLVPTAFNGGADDYWVVRALQLIEYEATSISNIQDKIFLENRDRDYDEYAIQLKGAYTPIDVQSFNSKFGQSQLFGGGEQYSIEMSFQQILNALGRPMVIGDIIQLPSETQYSPTLRPIYKYLEVTDVNWSTNGYSPTWKPLIQKIIAEPIMASQETQDIMGKLTASVDSTGLFDNDDGNAGKKYQDYFDVSQTIEADANTKVPVKGADPSLMTKLSPEMYEWANENGVDVSKFDRKRSQYGIDAMPPNGLPYTEGDTFPESPKDNDYHRLTYTNVSKTLPTRLYRYSSLKSRWIYLETDRRAAMKNTKPMLEEFREDSEPTSDPATATDKALDTLS
jgi:hypothetical protein